MAGKKIPRTCGTCQKQFEAYASQVTRRGAKYCSAECYHAAPKDQAAKFWSRVVKAEGCWLWSAGRSDKNYGAFYWHGKQTGAHCVSYELTYGSVPDGLGVLHRCDNPPCVRPDHLFLGTDQDNMTDKTEKGRAYQGSDHHSAILNDEDVREARQLYATGAFTYQVIADHFSVSLTVIHRAITRRTWKHVV